MLVGSHTEMFDCFSCVLWSPEQHDVRSGWVLHGQLINGHAATTGLLDPSTRCSGEAEGGDMQSWDGEESVVVCDSGDDADSLIGVGFLGGFGGDF